MSLNNIQLTPTLLTGLYANALVASPRVPVSFLGNNKKNILLLVAHADAAYLPDNELQFLTTVLSACGLDLAQVAIVNWALQKEKMFSEVQAQLQPKKLILLDINPETIGLVAGENYTLYQSGGISYFAAPSLTEIEKTKTAKSSLWVSLKALFGI